MATKEEIIEALSKVEERIQRLRPRIEAGLERPLPSGTWTVHDAICHLAADANGVPGFLQRMERIAAGQPRRPQGFDIDAYNQRNIDERKHKPVAEVFAEISAGLAADRERIAALDEAVLQRQLPNVRGEVQPVSDQMRAYLAGHPNGHLDDIEKALQA